MKKGESMKILRLAMGALIVGFLCLSVSPAQACRHTNQPGSSLAGFWNWGPSLPLITLPCPEDFTTSTPGQGAASTAEQRLTRFVEATFDNLTADMARGEGEYVSSLASLLNLPATEQTNFAEQLREASLAAPASMATQDSFLRLVQGQATQP